jgi:Family of unknown function (DUF5681)
MANDSKQLPPDETSDCDFPVSTENTDPASLPEIKGRFQRGQSGNPKGRPKGAFNKATMAARAILEENSTRLMAKAVELALSGSFGPLKLCLERLVPRDRPIQMPNPAAQNDKGQNNKAQNDRGSFAPTEILAGHTSLLASVTAGDITPQEARAISALLEARRRSWEVSALSDQLDRIEDRHDRDKSPTNHSKGRPR